MTTDRPYIKSYLDKLNYKKVVILATKERRSLSAMVDQILWEYFEEYEKTNGKLIKVDLPTFLTKKVNS